MGEGVFFGQDKKAVEFREWLDSVGGTSERLPEGSFNDPSLPVTTSVNARLVVIDKPESIDTAPVPDVLPKAPSAPDGSNPRYSLNQPSLLVQHNLSLQSLVHADKMGGLAVPSLAVTHKDSPLLEFGEITLIGDANMVDPMGIDQALQVNGFENVDQPIKDRITAFLSTLKDMPTEYFEAKILQGVSIGAFTGAVVPDNISKMGLDVLKKNGITDIRYYAAGNKESRKQAIAGFSRVMFQKSRLLGTGLSTKAVEQLVIKRIGKKAYDNLVNSGKLEIIASMDASPSDGYVMDWDKPVGQTSLYPILQNLYWWINDGDRTRIETLFQKHIMDLTGGELYSAMNNLIREGAIEAANVNMLLRGLGVTGIRYFDESAGKPVVAPIVSGIEGYYVNGKATLVADSLSEQSVVATLLHELGGHGGLQTMLSRSAFESLNNSFNKLVKDGNKLALKAVSIANRASKSEAEAKEEYIPYLLTEAYKVQQDKDAQSNVVVRLFNQAIRAVRAFMVDKWGVQLDLTPDDMVALAERVIRRKASRFVPPTPPKGTTRSYADTPIADQMQAVRTKYKGTGKWMKAPNGKATNLTERQWVMVRTPAFKQWFGDWENDPKNASRVVDDNGEPRIVFHGTQKQWTVYDPVMSVYSGASGNTGDVQGFYASTSPYIASTFAMGESGMPLPFSYENRRPDGTYDFEFYDDQMGAGSQNIEASVMPVFLNIRSPEVFNGLMGLSRSWGKTPEQGTDGYIREHVADEMFNRDSKVTGTTYIAFSPNQIKSAFNTGAFDPSNPDIRYSMLTPEEERRIKADETAPLVEASRIPEQPKSIKERFMRRFQEDMVEGYLGRKVLEFFDDGLGTPLDRSLSSKEFAPVYNLIQERMNHIAVEASHSIEVAPDLLGRRDNLKDFMTEVKGVTTEFNKNQEDMAKAGRALLDGTLIEKRVFSDDVLRRHFSLNDEQIALYRKMRKVIDTSLEQLAKTHVSKIALLRDVFTDVELHRLHDQDLPIDDHIREVMARFDAVMQGLDPQREDDAQLIEQISNAREKIGSVVERIQQLKIEGYAPLMRFGLYDLRVEDELGNTLVYEMFETERQRNRAKKALLESGVLTKGMTLTTNVKNPEEYKLFQQQGINPETLSLFSDIAGLNDDAVYQAYLKTAVAPQSALRRMIHRKGIAGFSEDMGRVMSAFVISNARRSANILYRDSIDTAVMNIQDGREQLYAQKLAEYVSNPVEELAGFRSFMFFMNMGFSLRYGLLNLTQPYLQTLPELIKYTGDAKKTGRIVMRASKVAFQSMQNDAAIPANMKADYEYLKRQGYLEPQNIWALQGRERGQSSTMARMSVLMHASGMIAQFTETMIAALNTAYSLPKGELARRGFDSPRAFAAHVIQTTQAVLNKGNRPTWARGVVGAPLFLFRTFSIQYVEQMIRMIRTQNAGGEERKKAMKAFIVLLLMLFGLSGATGLPFAKDLIDVVETGFAAAGRPVNVERLVQENVSQEMSEAILYGVINQILPFDMSGSIGMGNLLPATRLFFPQGSQDMIREAAEVGGATGGFIARVADSGANLIEGNVGAAARGVLPRFAESAGQGVSILQDGEYRTRYGNKLTDASVSDGLLKLLDMNPSDLARQGRIRMLEREDEAIQKAAKERLRKRLIAAYENGTDADINEAYDNIEVWNEVNPKYPVEINESNLQRSLDRRSSSWEDREQPPKGLEWMQDLR